MGWGVKQTEDLLAKTEANKALNDKKRLATSGANFERSRTVTDGVCAFPNNLVRLSKKCTHRRV
jgi:photosystem I subunit PsaN